MMNAQKEKISPSALFNEGIHLIDVVTENFTEAIQQINKAPTDAIEEALNALKNLDDVVTQLTKELIARAEKGETLTFWSYRKGSETFRVINKPGLESWAEAKGIDLTKYVKVSRSISIADLKTDKGADIIKELVAARIISQTIGKSTVKPNKKGEN